MMYGFLQQLLDDLMILWLGHHTVYFLQQLLDDAEGLIYGNGNILEMGVEKNATIVISIMIV